MGLKNKLKVESSNGGGIRIEGSGQICIVLLF